MLRNLNPTKTAVVALAVLLLAGSTSYAQRGRRGGRGFSTIPKAALLGSEQVQKELNITEEQKDQIEEIVKSSLPPRGSRESIQKLFELPKEERQKKIDEFREKMAKAAEEAGKKVAAVLDETQNKRLGEIVLQMRGTSALSDKEVAAKLKVTDEQQQKIKDLAEVQREMQRELYDSIREAFRNQDRDKIGELRKKGADLRTETQKAVLEVLTADQKSQFEQLKGKKFELDRSALRRSFGRRRGGDGERRRRDRDKDKSDT